jgi:hypothetical protein
VQWGSSGIRFKSFLSSDLAFRRAYIHIFSPFPFPFSALGLGLASDVVVVVFA